MVNAPPTGSMIVAPHLHRQSHQKDGSWINFERSTQKTFGKPVEGGVCGAAILDYFSTIGGQTILAQLGVSVRHSAAM